MYRVHFICRGNTFRSKLAEALLKSKQLDGIDVISSGLEAVNDLNGPISHHTLVVLNREHLTQWIKQQWVQTTQQMIDSSDLIVFMSQDIYDEANKLFSIGDKKYLTWQVKDIWQEFDLPYAVKNAGLDQEKVNAIASAAFDKIKANMNQLISKLPIEKGKMP